MSSSDRRTHHGPRRPGIGARAGQGTSRVAGTHGDGSVRPVPPGERARLVRCNPVHTTAPPALEARPISPAGSDGGCPGWPYAGARRRSGRRRARGCGLPPRPSEGRLPRRRCLLRAVRLPDHVALLLVEVETSGRVELAAFWARRARRLLPALVVVICGVVLVAALVSTPGDARQPARRPAGVALLRGELARHLHRRPATAGCPGPVPAAPHVVAGHRGAVLPRVAADLRARGGTSRSAGSSLDRHRGRDGRRPRPSPVGCCSIPAIHRGRTTAPTPGRPPSSSAPLRGVGGAPPVGRRRARPAGCGRPGRDGVSRDRRARSGVGATAGDVGHPLPRRSVGVRGCRDRGRVGLRARTRGSGCTPAGVPPSRCGRPRELRALPLALAGHRLADAGPHRARRRVVADPAAGGDGRCRQVASYYVVERPIRRGSLAPRQLLVWGGAAAIGCLGLVLVVTSGRSVPPLASSGGEPTPAADAPSRRPPSPAPTAAPSAAPATGAVPTTLAAVGPEPGQLPTAAGTVPPTVAATTPATPPRVLVVGDSGAWFLGEAMAAEAPRVGAVVLSRGWIGCGVAARGRRRPRRRWPAAARS